MHRVGTLLLSLACSLAGTAGLATPAHAPAYREPDVGRPARTGVSRGHRVHFGLMAIALS
ncbi:hypothetical protein [Streptacidiphilus sp. EB129]|uniref:hypothetical protein n=1 Tax=Streptacidiphilus sp. EB129 TaxID=3156262 RepID=UPI0035149A85